MALDLSALEAANAPSPSLAAAESGKPLRAALDRFYEDPNQPRTEFDPVALKKFSEDLKLRGVMSAVIVCPPDADGRMKIRHGARRFRGSELAGLPDLPFVIEEDDKIFDDYSQVAENVQRESLTPMELAKFIEKRLNEGDKKSFIARNIGIHDSDLTYLMSLTRAPDFITDLYHSGRCRTPKYLYELENLARKHPNEVEAFCATSDEITRKSIAALSVSFLRNSKDSPDVPRLDSGSGEQGGFGSGGDAGAGASNEIGEKDSDGALPNINKLPFHNPETERGTGKTTTPDPSKIKKPLLLGKIGKREVQVLLYKRPSGASMVHVKYEDGSGEAEVEFGTVKQLFLTEATA